MMYAVFVGGGQIVHIYLLNYLTFDHFLHFLGQD